MIVIIQLDIKLYNIINVFKIIKFNDNYWIIKYNKTYRENTLIIGQFYPLNNLGTPI